MDGVLRMLSILKLRTDDGVENGSDLNEIQLRNITKNVYMSLGKTPGVLLHVFLLNVSENALCNPDHGTGKRQTKHVHVCHTGTFNSTCRPIQRRKSGDFVSNNFKRVDLEKKIRQILKAISLYRRFIVRMAVRKFVGRT